MSTDPAIQDYFPEASSNEGAAQRNENLPGLGGVYNSRNLQLYHYAANNPLKYNDPTGKIVQINMANEADRDAIMSSMNANSAFKLELKVTGNKYEVNVPNRGNLQENQTATATRSATVTAEDVMRADPSTDPIDAAHIAIDINAQNASDYRNFGDNVKAAVSSDNITAIGVAEQAGVIGDNYYVSRGALEAAKEGNTEQLDAELRMLFGSSDNKQLPVNREEDVKP